MLKGWKCTKLKNCIKVKIEAKEQRLIISIVYIKANINAKLSLHQEIIFEYFRVREKGQ